MNRSKLSSVARRSISVALAVATVAGAARAADGAFSGRVRAYTTNTHRLYVGSETRVIVDGDGDTDLDCWLYNPAGRLVSRDTDSTDYCVLAAPDVGTHRLVIRNFGDVYNDYIVSKQ
jgi:hypothetical protein